jgi:hypothetical protein
MPRKLLAAAPLTAMEEAYGQPKDLCALFKGPELHFI